VHRLSGISMGQFCSIMAARNMRVERSSQAATREKCLRMPTSQPIRPYSCGLAAVLALVGFSLAPRAQAGAADPPSEQTGPGSGNSPGLTSTPDRDSSEARSFWVPAIEIPSFQFLLNRFDHYAIDADTYPAPWTNLRTNLHRSWVIDNDKFSTNQFLHPYQGSIYQGLARSAGLDFWQASAYTFLGSALWEETGENTAPSINDQIATGIGGNFLGEPLFRLANLLLEGGEDGRPSWWRALGAAVISPPTAFNRLVYGKRFAPAFHSFNPAVVMRMDVSGNFSSQYQSNIRANADPSAPPGNQTVKRGSGTAAIAVGYGLPGKAGYEYERPFDYFDLEFTLDSASSVESIFSRGLLVGQAYEAGPGYRGIWGLYGLYDYSAPTIFRVSNTGGAFGTTGQWWLSRQIALQSTALIGIGYAGGGVIRSAGVTAPGPLGEGQRNYHYGLAPESIVALKLIFGERAALECTARGYYISKIAASESTGSETLDRIDVRFTLRVHGPNGLTIRYTDSNRDGRYVNLPDSHQRVQTVSIGYTVLGPTGFGAVDWRRDTSQ